MQSEIPVAITGMGLVTSLGEGVDACFRALAHGRSGCRRLGLFEADRFNLENVYEIRAADGKPGPLGGRASRWLMAAIAEALSDAGETLAEGRTAVVVGTGLRELGSLERWRLHGEPFKAADLHFTAAVRERFGCRGPVVTLSNACSASLFALDACAQLLQLGEADVVVAAGTDSITSSMLGLIDRTNPNPPSRLRPFAAENKGVLMGEGAAAVVLRRGGDLPHPRAAKAYLKGVGIACDAVHETAPDRGGMVRAIRDAHDRAGISPGDVGTLWAHGTGTHLNDATESRALEETFQDALPGIPVLGLKSSIGHTSGASGLAAVVVAVEGMRRGVLPPTLGGYALMGEAERLSVRFEPGPCDHRIAQVNAFGFGGVNAVAILEGAVAP